MNPKHSLARLLYVVATFALVGAWSAGSAHADSWHISNWDDYVETTNMGGADRYTVPHSVPMNSVCGPGLEPPSQGCSRFCMISGGGCGFAGSNWLLQVAKPCWNFNFTDYVWNISDWDTEARTDTVCQGGFPNPTHQTLARMAIWGSTNPGYVYFPTGGGGCGALGC